MISINLFKFVSNSLAPYLFLNLRIADNIEMQSERALCSLPLFIIDSSLENVSIVPELYFEVSTPKLINKSLKSTFLRIFNLVFKLCIDY